MQRSIWSRLLFTKTCTFHRDIDKFVLRKAAFSAYSTFSIMEGTIESPPKAGQILTHDGIEYNTIKEGRAYILVPPGARATTDPKAKEDPGDAQKVFYNPIQQFNRDLSVLAIRAFSEDFESRRTQRSKVGRKERLQQGKQKQKDKREKAAAALNQDALPPVDGHNPDGAQRKGQVNPRKRKSEDDAQDVATEKRQRLDESHTTNGATGFPEQSEVEPSHTEPAPTANGTAIEPAAASALPTGQRPDDKLRPHMRILDALSATGLRALRYASELPIPTQIVANDLLPKATAAIKLNAMHNKLTHAIKPVTSNAQAHMYSAAFGYSEHAYGKYDVIDLDPYGSAVSFLDSALLALQSPGLLCVTCTDAGVFNSLGYLEKTYALYGGIPIKGFHAHEGGLRLILHAIATAAAKHGLTIEPLLSLSIDFYARVFVRVRHAPVEVKHLASKTMLVHSCDHGCGSWSTQFIGRAKKVDGRRGAEFWKFQQSQTTADKLCEHCGSKTHLAGPMWGGPLHNPYFIERILGYLPDLDLNVYQTTERIEGMLNTALEELDVIPGLDNSSLSKPSIPSTNGKAQPSKTQPAPAPTDPPSPSLLTGDEPPSAPPKPSSPPGHLPSLPPHLPDPHPFYFQPSALSSVLKCSAPPEAAICGALRKMGYVATRTHAKPGMIKTQAPWDVVWDVMRGWVEQRAPVKEGSLKEGGVGWRVMNPGLWKGGGGEGWKEGREVGGEGERREVGEGEGKEAGAKEGKREGKIERKREVVFDEVLGKDKQVKKLTRYQQNPRANWGPMSRAKG
ncbi:hypothetical protein KVT40_005465 [Elsinoe batatas]|uniref:tRNA (guanine(26)-N(2))-dimethyltransferase n=1 Tax=Elsinoe batatas TaxID=2601811 RepID=A0A8K0PC54_9PEZI|nr:hypothetical protein KVT40_005465 [Elsinoe batatas]